MAARTLSSTWKNFERIITGTGRKSARSKATTPGEALATLVEKVNDSRVTGALADLFVHPYPDMDEISVGFRAPESLETTDNLPTEFDAESKTIYIDPVGVHQFCLTCRNAADALKTPETRESFLRYRLYAYLSELAKLPPHYMMIVLLLREVANAREITRVVRKGGTVEVITERDERDYMNLLWAFKELETFYQNSNGLSMRAEHGIHWHESDWIVGR